MQEFDSLADFSERTFSWTSFLLCLLAFFWLSASEFSLADERTQTSRIGFVSDTRSSGAFFGVPSTIGARLAEQELKKAGEKIEILFEESENQPAKGVTATTRLLAVEKVDAVMSDLTAVSSAIAPLLSRANRIHIYQSPARSIEQQYTTSFMNFMDYEVACGQIVSRWKAEGKRIAVLAPLLEYGELCNKGALAADPSPLSYRFNSGDDLRTAITKFAADKRTALLIVGVESDFLSAFQNLHSQSFAPELGLIELMLTSTLLARSGESLKGSLVAGFEILPDDFLKRLHAFDERSVHFSPSAAALSYNAVYALHEALKSCPTREQACMLAQLKKPPVIHLLEFRGWSGQNERYPIQLRRFDSITPTKE